LPKESDSLALISERGSVKSSLDVLKVRLLIEKTDCLCEFRPCTNRTGDKVSSACSRRAKPSVTSWMPYASAVRGIGLYSTQTQFALGSRRMKKHLAFLLLAATVCLAQSTSSVSGTVTDPSTPAS